MPCTVGGSRNSESERVTFTEPLRSSAPSSNSACTISSMKNGLPPVRSTISRLSGLSSTLSPIFGAIVDQQQHLSVGDAFGQEIEQRLRLAVDPVQVFENHNYGLNEA